MKRLLVISVLAFMMCGCEAISNIGKIWDYKPFDPVFVILDDQYHNAYTLDPDYLDYLEIEYDGEIYRVNDDNADPEISTLDYIAGPARLRVDRFNPTYFIFGEFTMGRDGEFKIRYKENEWHVRFDTNILKPGKTESIVYIDGVQVSKQNCVWGEGYTLQGYTLFMPSSSSDND
mgnify:FL=1